MKVGKEDHCVLWVGKPKPIIFKYCVERSMTKEIGEWLHENFKGYGMDYYYSHGEIWFKTGQAEMWFMLRWE